MNMIISFYSEADILSQLVCIISHMITGIPPNQDADEFFASRNNSLKKFVHKMKRRLSGGDAKKPSSTLQIYRRRAELPLEINEVITELTHYNVYQRCTVRNARNLAWIKDNDGTEESFSVTEKYPCMKAGSPVNFLPCSISTSDTFVSESHFVFQAQ